MLPYGQSDDPASPHFDDQTQLYAEDEYKQAWYRAGDIFKNLESTTTLTCP